MLPKVTRRNFLASAATGAALAQFPGTAGARYAISEDEFPYEVKFSPSEWMDRLGPDAFEVMRLGGTEEPKSHPLWDTSDPGIYTCKGCELPLYDARWKVVNDLGWLFFRHSYANAHLLGFDRPERQKGDEDVTDAQLDQLAMVETHCRRCGSHLGHVVSVENRVLHCINGMAMEFAPASG